MELGDWSTFSEELSSVNSELLIYPERSFHFPHIQETIVISQSIDAIGTVIWDAEVILAHYLDNSHQSFDLNRKLFLEIGAGTALASIVAGKSGANLFLQELDEVIEQSQSRIEQNHLLAQYISGLWGNELAKQILERSKDAFDMIVMADVLYHPEHFQDLNVTILTCSKVGTEVIIVYELRRRELESYFTSLRDNFEILKVLHYDVIRQEEEVVPSNSLVHTNFYLYHLRRIR